MSYGDVLKNGWNTFLLKSTAMGDLAKDSSAVKFGLLTVLIYGLLASIGGYLNTLLLPAQTGLESLFPLMGPSAILAQTIAVIVMFVVGYSLIHLIAKGFGGKASWGEYFGVISNATVVLWISVIPFIGSFVGGLASIWMLVVNVVILKNVHGLTTGRAIGAAIIIPALIGFVLMLILGATFFAGLM